MNKRGDILSFALVIAGLGGCGGDAETDSAADARTFRNRPVTTAPAMDESWQSAPLPVTAEAVAVKEGASPLVYMTEGRGRYRITDVTTGRTLAEASAPAQTILRVDERYGVVFGKATLHEGPLPRGHRYAISRQPEGPNVVRQGTLRPRPR